MLNGLVIVAHLGTKGGGKGYILGGGKLILVLALALIHYMSEIQI